MKNLLFAIFTCTALISCSKKYNTQLTGTISGLSKGNIYLQKIIDTSLVTLDSIKVNGSNQFDFNFNLDEADVYYLYLDKNDGSEFNDRLEVFLEPGELKFYSKVYEFKSASKISGSPNHQKLVDYKNMMTNFNKDDFTFSKLDLVAQKTANKKFSEAILSDYKRHEKRKYLYTINYALQNKDLEIAPYLAVTQIPNANKKYLDTIYSSLTPKIKESKYGRKLKKLIN